MRLLNGSEIFLFKSLQRFFKKSEYDVHLNISLKSNLNSPAKSPSSQPPFSTASSIKSPPITSSPKITSLLSLKKNPKNLSILTTAVQIHTTPSVFKAEVSLITTTLPPFSNIPLLLTAKP